MKCRRWLIAAVEQEAFTSGKCIFGQERPLLVMNRLNLHWVITLIDLGRVIILLEKKRRTVPSSRSTKAVTDEFPKEAIKET